MFSGEKILVIFVTAVLIVASVYFVMFKLNQDIFGPVPSPSPQILDFLSESNHGLIFNASGLLPSAQPSSSDRPYSKNKKIPNPPWLNKTLKPEYINNKRAIIQTAKGIIQLEIYPEASAAASNFIMLASNGFYDGLTFHRVEKGFVIQGGDPDGNGTGGPGYQFADEPVTRDYYKGIVAYANAGSNTNGSQFFIMLADHLGLPKRYVTFGKVISGMEVAEKIQIGDIMQQVLIQELN